MFSFLQTWVRIIILPKFFIILSIKKFSILLFSPQSRAQNSPSGQSGISRHEENLILSQTAQNWPTKGTEKNGFSNQDARTHLIELFP